MPEKTDEIKQYLIEWAINYCKHKDIIAKAIKNIEKLSNNHGDNNSPDVVITLENKNHSIFVLPFIDIFEDVIKKIKSSSDKGDKVTLVVVNNNKNLLHLIKNWNKLVNISHFFSIIFVNPFSTLDTKWVIFPSTHHSISDENALETGLKSLFSSVEEIDENSFKSKIKADME